MFSWNKPATAHKPEIPTHDAYHWLAWGSALATFAIAAIALWWVAAH